MLRCKPNGHPTGALGKRLDPFMDKPAHPFSLTAALSSIVLAWPAAAQDQSLTGPEIEALLAGNTAIADDGSYTQFFDPNGETPYLPTGGEVDVGRWTVRGDQYCSQWGGRGWDCYDVEGTDDHIVWISPGGSRFAAQVVTGNQMPD
jgi:hypothetical protein